MSKASKLRKWLLDNEKTLTWLMRETQLSWATVSRVANGRNVRLETALKLARATKMPASAFTDTSTLTN